MPYRDWMPPDQAATEPTGPADHVPPRSGTGTVWVNRSGDHWYAVWQGETELEMENTEGARDEVLAWARSRPAARHLIFSVEADDWIALTH